MRARAEVAALRPRLVWGSLAVLATIAAVAGIANRAGAAAVPRIVIFSPRAGGSYQRGARVVARYRCSEGGSTSAILSCHGTVPDGRAIDTRLAKRMAFSVTATDASGTSVTRSVRYDVWAYVNPLRRVAGLRASRVDMGVDYSGSGPIEAIGRAKVITARYVPGPESCWGRTCAPAPGAWVVYQLLDGPFAGKYVYAVENLTIKVRAGQLLREGQTIAILHPSSPNLELGWASGRLAETLAVQRHHRCTCVDPGGWSAIEGRNFDAFLVWLGAPSGYLQESPDQRMPAAWPSLPRRHQR